VLDPFVAASFASIIGRTLSADAVQRGRSLFAGREGDQIAATGFRLADDGLHPEGLATSPFDGEGVARQTTALIDEGVLRTYLFDTYTANKAQRASTGNGDRGSYRTPPSVSPSNLLVAAGDASDADLLKAAGDGLYVMSVTGLHSGVNPVSGSFSVGATGRLIRDGELAEPAREMTIASDLLAMLQGVTRAGAIARWVPFGGSVQAPALLVQEMTVAGA
jgi:PmbA protein